MWWQIWSKAPLTALATSQSSTVSMRPLSRLSCCRPSDFLKCTYRVKTHSTYHHVSRQSNHKKKPPTSTRVSLLIRMRWKTPQSLAHSIRSKLKVLKWSGSVKLIIRSESRFCCTYAKRGLIRRHLSFCRLYKRIKSRVFWTSNQL